MPSTLYSMYAAQNIGSRGEQQDSVNASRPEIQKDVGVICVIADGMGGLTGGKEASQLTVDTMVSTFNRSAITDTLDQILLRGCAFAQEAVRKTQQEPGKTGTTLAAVIIRNDRCSFLSVGDSRIYLYRGGGLIQLNREQNKGARIDAQIGLGRMAEAARTDGNRRALTGYIGMEHLEHTDRSSAPFTVGPGDRLLLLTDGVFGTLSEEEIASAMGERDDLICDRIIAMVMEKRLPNQDNCTAALIDCSYGEAWF